MIGEDVFALQTALNGLGFPCGTPDGYFGPKTDYAVSSAQKKYFLTVDAMAGGITQKVLAMEVAEKLAPDVGVPLSAFRGQLEFESGFRLGNYSPPRPEGDYDAGVTQRNTQFHPPKEAFDVPKSILLLGQTVRKHYDLFVGLPPLRRLALAQGAWNAPAFACYLAREEGATRVTAGMTLRPGIEARKTFENYVSEVSVYLTI